MSKELGPYDSSTQMFVHPERDMNFKVAGFHKYLVTEGKYDDDMHADIIRLDEVRKELAELGQH